MLHPRIMRPSTAVHRNGGHCADLAEERPLYISRPTSMVSRRWVLIAGLSASALIVGRSPETSASLLAEDLQARFLQWSRVATGFAELDASVARVWTLDPTVYRGTDLEKRLLDTWYTGVFAPDASPGVRHDETTLMWRAAGIEPPGQCHGGPDAWTTEPDLQGATFGRPQ
jgi:hypothetical protein